MIPVRLNTPAPALVILLVPPPPPPVPALLTMAELMSKSIPEPVVPAAVVIVVSFPGIPTVATLIVAVAEAALVMIFVFPTPLLRRSSLLLATPVRLPPVKVMLCEVTELLPVFAT